MAEIVVVKVVQARGLPKVDRFGTIDPYFVLKYGNKSKKTKMVKNSQTPTFNETFFFEYDIECGDEISVELWDWDRMSKDDFVAATKFCISEYRNRKEKNWFPLIPDASVKGNEAEVELEVVFNSNSMIGGNFQDSSCLMTQNPQSNCPSYYESAPSFMSPPQQEMPSPYSPSLTPQVTIAYPTAKDQYVGSVRLVGGKQKPHGKGICRHDETKQRYEGDWVDGKREGKGWLTYPGGEKGFYTFVDDVPEGEGTIYYTDGRTFKGNFSNGIREGYGIATDKDGKVVAEGYWKNGNFPADKTKTYTALYECQADKDGFSMNEGDTLFFVFDEMSDQYWVRVENRSGEVHNVPRNFVRQNF